MKTKLVKISVIEFHVDNGVTVVPSSWISEQDGEKYCAFPNPIPKEFETIKSNANSRPGKDWIIYEVTCVKTYGKNVSLTISLVIYSKCHNLCYIPFCAIDNYNKAKAKAKRYIKHQQIDSTDTELGRGRRHRKKENVLVAAPVFEPPHSLLHENIGGN